MQFVRIPAQTQLVSFFFLALVALERNEADALFYAPRKNTRVAEVRHVSEILCTRLVRSTACTLHMYLRRIVSQLGNAADWCRVSVSVGAFAAAVSLLFGVLKHDTPFLSASEDRFLYRRCNL